MNRTQIEISDDKAKPGKNKMMLKDK